MSRGVDNEMLVAAVTEPTRRQLLDLLLERGASTATALADDRATASLAELAADWDTRPAGIKRLAEAAHARNTKG